MKDMTYSYTYAKGNNSSSKYSMGLRDEDGFYYPKYTQSKNLRERGNPFIEALPLPRSREEILQADAISPISYDYADEMKKSPREQLLSLADLKDVHFVMPMQENMEATFSLMLHESYRMRTEIYSSEANVPLSINSRECKGNSILCGELGGTIDCFAILGLSGCGKTTAIKEMTKNYPQVIRHRFSPEPGKPIQLIQVPWLSVDCDPNGNLTATAESIAASADITVGNTNHFYENLIHKAHGIAEKYHALIQYIIEPLHVGCIIFDEIQHLDFSKNRESSFDTILTLQNRSKVGIVVVGTTEAYEKMFKGLLNSRRVGKLINADVYCKVKESTSTFLSWLLEYQWFAPRLDTKDTALMKDLRDAMQETTGGLIALIVAVYQLVNFRFIMAPKSNKPKIDGAFIRNTVKKYFPWLKKCLENAEKGQDVSDDLEKAVATAQEIIQKEAAEKDTAAFFNQAKVTKSAEEANISEKDIQDTIHCINACYPDLQIKEIRETYIRLFTDNANKKLSHSELTSKVLASLLNKHHSKPNKRRNVIDGVLSPEVCLSNEYQDLGVKEDN